MVGDALSCGRLPGVARCIGTVCFTGVDALDKDCAAVLVGGAGGRGGYNEAGGRAPAIMLLMPAMYA